MQPRIPTSDPGLRGPSSEGVGEKEGEAEGEGVGEGVGEEAKGLEEEE